MGQETTDLSDDIRMRMISAEQLTTMAETDAQQALQTLETASPSEEPITPLAIGLGLYVEIKWPDPHKRMTMKTTYSTQSEADAD